VKTTRNISELVRPNIRNLKPYSSARDEFRGRAEIFLDANENPYPTAYNRYPDPLQLALKERISASKGVPSSRIFLGNGSDEAIDLLIRAFCEPNRDAILVPEPTYGMYSVCADINAVQVQRVLLSSSYDLDLPAIRSATDRSTRIIFLCSPNNPSANLLTRETVLSTVEDFDGLVVVDEAYIDFSGSESYTTQLNSYPNLVVLQTFSKAWGLAGLRLGMCFAQEMIVSVLNKIKYPYNINCQTQELVLKALANESQKDRWVNEILNERAKLVAALNDLEMVRHVYPSDANFVLVRVDDASGTYRLLMEMGTIVRDRSRVVLCEDCLRITVGTPKENETLIRQLKGLGSGATNKQLTT
jgi:histidinol-phosphate aminotransferase